MDLDEQKLWNQSATKHKTDQEHKQFLLDCFAGEAMNAEVASWNTAIDDTQRTKRTEYWIRTYGDVTIAEGIAKNAYDVAEAMMKERETRIKNQSR